MIVSSVYSWLKDLRSNFDIYDDSKQLNSDSSKGMSVPKPLSNSPRKCSCTQHSNESYVEDMFDIPEIETVLLRNNFRRSVPLKKNYRATTDRNDKAMSFADLCIQERAKKTWSVGDAWGVDFQLNSFHRFEDKLKEHELQTNEKDPRRDSISTLTESDDNVKEALDQFSFLSDIETDSEPFEDPMILKKENQPVYVNITTIGNPRLRQELTNSQRDSTMSNMSLSSAYSFVSCEPSEGTWDATSMSSFGSSGTYTLNSGGFKSSESSMASITSTFSGATFQTEDNTSIRDYDYWTAEEWKSLGSLNNEGNNIITNPAKPLKKGKSLESFNLPRKLSLTEGETSDVQLRRKDNSNRRSVIPILETSEVRKAIILPKCKNADQQSAYMNIWECYTEVGGKVKPVPSPRTKFAKPVPSPKPRNHLVRMSSLEIKKARENIVSFAFDETVEYLQFDEPLPKTVDNACKRLPPLDVIMWMTHLHGACEWEPDELPGANFESNELFSKSATKISKSREQDIMLGHQSPGASLHSITDKFDFNNVKKYKMDNHVVKLAKNDIIEKQDGKLLHKNSEGTKTLAENIRDCHFEQRSPKEHILILPDNKKIYLYNRNPKEKPTPLDSPESLRSSSSKADRMNRLMQFFIRRPERDTLRDRGILKNENVFGNTLGQLENRNFTSVPNLVRKCIEYVELPANIVTQGLYRSSASLAILQEIRFAINDTDGKDLSSLEKYKLSPDVPSGLLKLFIRELKEPLIGIVEFEKMHNVCKNSESAEAKFKALFSIIAMMQPSHKDTLDVLLTHLIKVISYREQNEMTIEGISICWGQSMITENPPGCDPVMIARKRNDVVEMLLKAYDAQINCSFRRGSQDNWIVSPENLKVEDQRAEQENNLNQTKEITKDLIRNEDTENGEKEKLKVNPIKKPKRLPHRQGSVEAHMKPNLTKSSPKTSKTSLASIESGTSASRLSNQSGNAGSISGFVTSGNYVQVSLQKTSL